MRVVHFNSFNKPYIFSYHHGKLNTADYNSKHKSIKKLGYHTLIVPIRTLFLQAS